LVLHTTNVFSNDDAACDRKGTLIIDSSTIDPTVSKALIGGAAAKGVRMVDAPVSGGVGGKLKIRNFVFTFHSLTRLVEKRV
jgi:3-hydroxyisobutyrate dehydrogenase-like beta-hydroxyacid dehydrogenase